MEEKDVNKIIWLLNKVINNSVSSNETEVKFNITNDELFELVHVYDNLMEPWLY